MHHRHDPSGSWPAGKNDCQTPSGTPAHPPITNLAQFAAGNLPIRWANVMKALQRPRFFIRYNVISVS